MEPNKNVAVVAASPLRTADLVAPVILVVLGLLVYSNSFQTPFVFDGDRLIHAFSADRFWPWQLDYHDSRPFGTLSFSLNYAWGRDAVWGYHAVNLLIHVLAGWILYGIVRRTLARPPLADRHARWLAFAVAAIWLVHPLQTESVTYIVQRFESLMALFYLLTLYCFIRAQDSGGPGVWYAASVVACALGMGTKEVTVSAPLVVLWYDRALVARCWREIWRTRWKYYAALAGTWILLAFLMTRPNTLYEAKGILSVHGVTPWAYARSQPGVIAHYLRLCFWPSALCLDYTWQVAKDWLQILLPGLLIGSLLSATVWCIFRHPALGFVAGSFFLILAPTSSVAPIADLAVEHRMYLPLAAVATLVVVGGYRLCETLRARWTADRRTAIVWSRALMMSALIAAVAGLGCRTRLRNADYRSDAAIWRSVLEHHPENQRAHYSLAVDLLGAGDDARALVELNLALLLDARYTEAYVARGRIRQRKQQHELAVADFSKAIRLAPGQPITYLLRGKSYTALGNEQPALADFDRAVTLAPHNPTILNSRASLYQRIGKLNDALADLDRAIELAPDYAEAYYNRAVVHAVRGELDLGLSDFTNSIERAPRFAPAYNGRGAIYQQTGRCDDAIKDFTHAISLLPDQAISYKNRAAAYAAAGHNARAVADFTRSLELAPLDTAVYQQRGAARVQMQDYEHALQDYTKAIELAPKDAAIYFNRGSAYVGQLKFDQAIKDYETAIDLRPDYAEARRDLGKVHGLLSRYRTALDEYSKAVARDPRDRSAYKARADTYAQFGERERAIEDYTKLIELDPQDADAYNSRANLYASGNAGRAAADYGKVIELKPEFSKAYFNRAIVRAACHLYEQAIADCTEAIRLNPKYATAFGHRARLQATCPDARLRNGARAVADATRACELTDWKNVACLDTLGAAYAEQGDFRSAIEWQTKALELPDGDEAFCRAAKRRLELYQAGKPYHVAPGD